MGPTPISTAFLLISLLAVALLEAAAAVAAAYGWLSGLKLIAATRTLQMLAVVALASVQTGGLRSIGLDGTNASAGFKKGLVWSMLFGAITALLFGILWLTGRNPLALIRSPLPHTARQQSLYFLVGGVIAPAAEEMAFRGLVFGYLRRWGAPAAMVISTALFAAFHSGPAVPVTQIIGGLVFAAAYHQTGSLMAPIVIHGLGNLAIFSLSLPVFHPN